MKRITIIHSIQNAIKDYPFSVEVTLFGSEARGEARNDSDIDLLVIVDKDYVSVADELTVIEPLYDIELKSGVLINPFIIAKKQWGTRITPFYENVMKEGIRL